MNIERIRFLGAAAALVVLVAVGAILMVIDHRTGGREDVVEVEEWGLNVQTLTPDFAARLGIRESYGVIVTRIRSDSPASRAGLKQGDVILALNRKKVSDAASFWREMAHTREEALSLQVRRADSIVMIALESGKSR